MKTGEKIFPEGMTLLAHWNLRDEIRSNYGQPGGIEKKEMLYKVMLRIINQDIPEQVINSGEYQWNPYTNELWKEVNRQTLFLKAQGATNIFLTYSGGLTAWTPIIPSWTPI